MQRAAQDLLLDLWSRTRIDWGFASDRIAETFRRARWLGAQDRREVAETLYGMIRQARRTDMALESSETSLMSAASIDGSRRELARLMAYRLLAGEIDEADARRELPEVTWDDVLSVDERIANVRDPVRRFALARSLPDWLARRFLDEQGAEADALCEALNRRAPLTVRANALKVTREELAAKLAAQGIETRPTKLARHGLHLETRTNLFGLADFKEGLLEAQDEASQVVAELLDPTPRSIVVDLCAGAGGKTLALGALMKNRGRILALDPSPKKLEELRRRARRAGLSNHRAAQIIGGEWPAEATALLGRADRVLVDAPCSGLGALRRKPEARWRVTEEHAARLPSVQEEILDRAATLVAPGGRLVYATCTLLRAENQEVVTRFLAAHADFELVPVPVELAAPGEPYLTLTPHRHDTDGFFAALLVRRRAS